MKSFNIIFLSLSLLAFSFDSMAEESLVMPIGHNLDMTSSVMSHGHCTAGFQFTGCAITNDITFGISPWLLTEYNSYNLFTRWRFNKSDNHQQAMQFAYIKSYNYSGDSYSAYNMELIWLTYIHTIFAAPHYVAHLNFSGMYFVNETAPFSLRRPNFYKDPTQFNLGLLNELHLVGGWYVNAEFAFLDAIKKYIHLHMGLSLEYRGGNWLVHLGLSQTQTFDAITHPTRRYDNQQGFFGWGQILDESWVKYDYSIHPEIAAQFYF